MFKKQENGMNDSMDLLNRQEFIDSVIMLVNQLSDNKKGCCFAIEGGWGIGKSFVLEEIEKRLNTSKDNEFFLFHYNCWQYDYYEEPSIAIVSAMMSSIQKDETLLNRNLEDGVRATYKFVGHKLKEIAGIYIENKIGVNLVSWTEDVKNIKEKDEKSLYEFNRLFNFTQTIEGVRAHLREVAEERTIVLVVDELDRCVPQYAIKVLERLHHIFYGLDNIVVIMAIDRGQLEHSVEDMFGIKSDGGSMDVEKYLKKFIDFSMKLDFGLVNESFVKKYKSYFDRFSAAQGTDDMERLTELIPKLLRDMDIRMQEKLFEKAEIVHSILCKEVVDISVLLFEILFEVLESWRFGSMKNLVLLNDKRIVNLEQRMGEHKIALLKAMEKRAWNGTITNMSCKTKSSFKRITFNLDGKVFWYFANLFNRNEMPYYNDNGVNEEVEKGLEIATKYCELCTFIK